MSKMEPKLPVIKATEPRLIKLRVRRTGSKKFFKSSGRWTRKPDQAFDFPNLLNAVHTCMAKGWHDVELILRYDGDARDRRIALPMT